MTYTRGLTDNQAKVLAFLDSQDRTPSFREIISACGLKSTSEVSRILDGLVERGRIRRLYGRARSIEVVTKTGLETVSTSDLIGELDRRGYFKRAAA